MWKPSPWGVVKPKTAKVVENADQSVDSRSSPPASAKSKNHIWQEITSDRQQLEKTANDDVDWQPGSPGVEKTVEEALGIPWRSKSRTSGKHNDYPAAKTTTDRITKTGDTPSNEEKANSSQYNSANVMKKSSRTTDVSTSKPLVTRKAASTQYKLSNTTHRAHSRMDNAPVVSESLYDSSSVLRANPGGKTRTVKSSAVLSQEDLVSAPLISQLANMKDLLQGEMSHDNDIAIDTYHSQGTASLGNGRSGTDFGDGSPEDGAVIDEGQNSITDTDTDTVPSQDDDAAYDSDSSEGGGPRKRYDPTTILVTANPKTAPTTESSHRSQASPTDEKTRLDTEPVQNDEIYISFPDHIVRHRPNNSQVLSDGSPLHITKSAPAALPPSQQQHHQQQQRVHFTQRPYITPSPLEQDQSASPDYRLTTDMDKAEENALQIQKGVSVQQHQHRHHTLLLEKERKKVQKVREEAAAGRLQRWIVDRLEAHRIASIIGAADYDIDEGEINQSTQSEPTKMDTGVGFLPSAFGFDDDLLIERDEIELVSKIGEGFFGEVWRAKWNGSQDVACKKMKHDVTSAGDRNTLLSEVASLSKLRHPNVTVFYGVTSPPDAIIVCELLKASLFQLIHQHGMSSVGASTEAMLPLPVIVRILKDVAAGGAYLHRRKPPVIHRDLSTSNVLLSVPSNASHAELERACRDESKPVAKLTDFGLSRNVGWYMTSCVGNLFYLAPEVFSGDHYTESADVFSFGIMMWEIVSRQSPYEGQNPQRAAFLASTEHLRPSHAPGAVDRSPRALVRLRESCWHKNPLQRPSFSDVLSVLSNEELRTDNPAMHDSYGGYQSNAQTEILLNYAQFSQAAPPSANKGEWNWRRRTLKDLLSTRWALPLLLDRKILWEEDLDTMGIAIPKDAYIPSQGSKRSFQSEPAPMPAFPPSPTQPQFLPPKKGLKVAAKTSKSSTSAPVKKSAAFVPPHHPKGPPQATYTNDVATTKQGVTKPSPTSSPKSLNPFKK